MKKLLTAFFVLGSFSLPAQTLFQYGNESVSVNEFLKAYQKNNSDTKSEKAFREYLDLYIASRLKIKEAKAERYDTLPQIVGDLENLRHQITPAYMNDKNAVNKLVDEAFARSQKDIHLAHIFIRNTGKADELQAKKNQVLAALKTTAFSEVAKKFSDDPSAKKNGGDLGWITVFSLPYELENLAYNTPAGQVSQVYQSKAGLHIFKNIAERKDPGKVKASQILLAFPPEANDSYKAGMKKLADSLYNRLVKGDDFGKLASQFSNDVVSAANNGQMQEFGSGQFEANFENAVFSLQPNKFSKPFLTSHGYHIVKLISKTPAPAVRNEELTETLNAKVSNSDRINSIRTALVQKVKKETGYKSLINSNTTAELFLYTDSILTGKQNGIAYTINKSTPLIQVGKEKLDVANWIGYAQMNRYKPDGSGIKPWSQVWEEYTDAAAIKYYEDHLEDYNEEFRQQLTEFSEGNLFFEIMQRKIWGPAQTDSVALVKYFNQHQENYMWNKSADAVIFYGTDAASAQTFLKELKNNPKNWNSLTSQFAEKIAADSSRFELTQIPNPSKAELKPGTITNVQTSKTDNTVSFAYIVRNYNNKAPRSFTEARGLVINDYQVELEKNWLNELRQKYPVKINEAVLEDLVKNRKY